MSGSYGGGQLLLLAKACPDGLGGDNVIYLAPAVLNSLIPIDKRHSRDPFFVEINNSGVFVAKAHDRILEGSVGLDSVQRSTMSISINDEVSIRRLKGTEPKDPIVRVHFSLDFANSSDRRSDPVDANVLVRHIKDRFHGHVLRLRQHVLVICEGLSLRMRVIHLETQSSGMGLALCMGKHRRLGHGSWFSVLDINIIKRISRMCFDNNAAVAVLSSGTEIDCKAYANSPVNLRKPSKAAASAGERMTSATRTVKEYQTSDSTFGVGIELTRHESKNMMVSALLPGASVAPDDLRLLAGDLIESVNGQGVMGMRAKDAMDLTLGKHGTLVTFGILRGKARKFITLTRNVPQTGDGSSFEDKLPSSSRSVPQKASTPMSLAATNLFDEALAHSLDASAVRRSELAAGRQGLSTVRAAGGSASRERSPVSGEELERERGRTALYREQLQQAQGQVTEYERQVDEGFALLNSRLQETKKAKERELELGVLLQHARSDKQDLEREVTRLQRELAEASRAAGGGASREGQEESTTVGKLEEMVETLLALGEQEASALNSDLRETNSQLKSILGSLMTLEGTTLLAGPSLGRDGREASRLSPIRSPTATGALAASAWPTRWPAAQARPVPPSRPWPTSTLAASNSNSNSQSFGASMRSLSEATSALRESFQDPDADLDQDNDRLDPTQFSHPIQPSPLSQSWSQIRSSFSPSPPSSLLPGDRPLDIDRPLGNIDRPLGTINNAAPLPDPFTSFTAPTPQPSLVSDVHRPFPVPGPDASRRYSPVTTAPYGEIPGDVVEEIRRLLDRGKTVQQIMKNYKLQGLGLPQAQVQACVDSILSKGLLENRQRGFTPNSAPTPISHVNPTPTSLYRDPVQRPTELYRDPPGSARPLATNSSSFNGSRRRDPSPSSSDQTDNTVTTSRLGEDTAPALHDVSAYTTRVFASPPPRAGSPPVPRVKLPVAAPDDDERQNLPGTRGSVSEWEVSRASWRPSPAGAASSPAPTSAAIPTPTPTSAAIPTPTSAAIPTVTPTSTAPQPKTETPASMNSPRKGRWPTPRWSQRGTPPTAAPSASTPMSSEDRDMDRDQREVVPRSAPATAPLRNPSPVPTASRRVMDI